MKANHYREYIVILIFVFILGIGVTYAEWSIPSTFFSMQAHSLQGDTSFHSRTMDLMKNAGVKIIRDEMYWSNVEKEKGKIIIPDNYKQNVDISLAHGIDVLIILDYGNKFYDNGFSPNTPEGRAGFANYCYTIVSTFKGKIKYYEIWNEPNFAGFWKPKPSPSDYALLLQEAYKACKSADKDCVILGGVTSGVDIEYLDKVFESGGIQSMDILSLHPYRGDAPENGNSLISQLHKADDLMKKYKKPMRIWMTEMGYPTHIGSNGHSEEEQANYLTRCYLETLSTGLVDTFFWYWFGADGPDETYSEDRFGLIRQDWSLKPSYYAYQNLALNLSDGEFVGALKTKEDNVRGYQFHTKSNPTQWVSAIWNVRDSSSLGFETKALSIDLLNRSGFLTKYWTYQNSFTATITDSPIFLFTKTPIEISGKRLIAFDKEKLFSSPGGRRTLKLKLDSDLSKAFTGKSNLHHKIQLSCEPEELQVEPTEIFLLKPKSFIYSAGTTIRVWVPKVHPPKSGSVTATLIIGGRPRGFVTVNMEITPAAISWIRPFLQDSTGSDGFYIFIKNMSGDTIAGDVLVSSDTDILLDEPTRSFENLCPEDTAIIPVHIVDKGDVLEDSLFPVHAKILLQGLDVMDVRRSVDYLQCVKAKSPVVIDGKLDEWQHASFIEMGKPEQILTGKENYRGPQDFDGAVYTMWDENYFYIAAAVVDDTVSSMIDPGSTVHNSDGMEVYFDTDANGDLGNHKYNSKNFQYGFFDTPKGPIVWRWSPGDLLSPGAKIAFVRRNDLGPEGKSPGYVIEGSIPFLELGFIPEKGKLIGFTIGMDDDDTPESVNPFSQDKQFTWAGDKFNWTDPSKFGFLFLVE